mmetsp:Transcript_16994/g.36941  ORF Transcript_16994/g.36941 Transcript_16994/m.36941 type:complete len:119 (+) Transcript_16994:149-505(+)
MKLIQFGVVIASVLAAATFAQETCTCSGVVTTCDVLEPSPSADGTCSVVNVPCYKCFCDPNGTNSQPCTVLEGSAFVFTVGNQCEVQTSVYAQCPLIASEEPDILFPPFEPRQDKARV